MSMREKREEKNNAFRLFRYDFSEIVVARGRNTEPYIKAFRSTGDHIVRNDLGTLVGVFEITDRSDESGYIVNFLTSVAKKEFFSNPRRGTIESFEATLHKINIALSELVKHGNVSWLGNLHGVLAVLEKNTLHFSVTGESRVFLFRNGSGTEISEGLASADAKEHPLKTFIEVSSGRLSALDQIVLTTPAIDTLFTGDTLSRQAARMDPEQFSQFLKTAIRNELSCAASIHIVVRESEALPVPTRTKTKSPRTGKSIQNVFSETAFMQPKQPAAPPSIEESPLRRPEYTDSKTGHIFVQGEEPDPNTKEPSSIILLAEEWSDRILKRTSHTLRAISMSIRYSSLNGVQSIRGNIKHIIHSFSRPKPTSHSSGPIIKESFRSDSTPDSIQKLSTNTQEKETLSETSFHSDKLDQQDRREALARFFLEKPNEEKRLARDESLSTQPEKINTLHSLAQVLQEQIPSFKERFSRYFFRSLRVARKHIRRFFRFISTIPIRTKLTIAGTVMAAFIGWGVFSSFGPSETNTDSSPAEPVASSQNSAIEHSTEPKAISVSPTTLLRGDDLLFVFVLRDESFAVGKNAIYDIRENKVYPLPEGSGNTRLSTSMDDLSLLFVLTENNLLFSFSPINHKFIPNILSVPNIDSITSLSTYLTYLYTINSSDNTILRFPRAEGGFGEPKSWLREETDLSKVRFIAIAESIYLAKENGISVFSNGREDKNIRFESTASLLTPDALATAPENKFLYVLDKNQRRIIAYEKSGAIQAQFFSPEFSDAIGISVDEKDENIFVVTPDQVLNFSTRF